MGSTDGTFQFEVTQRFSIAYFTAVDAGGGLQYSTHVLNVTRDELHGVLRRTCPEALGNKSFTGSVAGLTGQQVVRLTMASRVAATINTTTFALDAMPDGPLGLVATRFPTATTQPPDRIIVRRDLNLQSSTQIPVLDFASNEAQALATHTLAFANRGSDPVHVRADFLSANGTRHNLMLFTGVSGPGSIFVSVPAGLRGPNDIHVLSTVATSAAGAREVSHYYRDPTDRTFTYGPMVDVPALSVFATSPYVRPRLTVASQAEYPSAMEAFFSQQSGITFRSVRVFTSAAFLGGRPATWELDVPDLAAGYQTEWGFVTGAQINANARGLEGPVRVLPGGVPRDGDMVKSSVRTSNNVTPIHELVWQYLLGRPAP
jgi:hypothetical protein